MSKFGATQTSDSVSQDLFINPLIEKSFDEMNGVVNQIEHGHPQDSSLSLRTDPDIQDFALKVETSSIRIEDSVRLNTPTLKIEAPLIVVDQPAI